MACRGVRVGGGVIDPDYRGEVKIIMQNLSEDVVHLGRGERVAQMLMEPVVIPRVQVTEELSATARADGGFGSTGTRMMSLRPVLESVASEEEARQIFKEMRARAASEEDTISPYGVPMGWLATVAAAPGETSTELLSRFRLMLLEKQRWVLPSTLAEILRVCPGGESSGRASRKWTSPEKVVMEIYRHAVPRRRLFDTEHEALMSPWNGCLHLMWLEDGGLILKLEERLGSRRMAYVSQPWIGYTVFYQPQ